MRKVPCYSTGGGIKGEPKKPVKSTIDRTKYTKELSAPISGEGTNVVGTTQDNFTPEVLKNMGYNYVSGTMGGKDIVYEKGGNYHIYNEQLDNPQSKYGLINIGNPYAVKSTNTAAPSSTVIQNQPISQPIDPNKKALNFNDPSLIYDPNTGNYKNNVTGKFIEPIVEQYKHGGKVKPLAKYYASGGSVGYNERFQAANQFTPDQGTVQDPNKVQGKQGGQLMNQAGTALGAYGTGYFGSQQNENKNEDIRAKGLAAVGQTGPIGGVISGAAALGDQIGKPIKDSAERTDAQGNLMDRGATKRNAVIGGLFSPSKALAMRGSYEGGWTDITGNKYADYVEKQAKEEAAKAAEERAKEQRIVDESRASNAILARDLGELNYEDDYVKRKKDFENKLNSALMNIGSYADGGVIKGAGTPKSDSIPAKIKPGSHIIPAENAPIAKEIIQKVLGGNPNKKANLNQKKGVPVMVSTEEVVITPEEKEKIESTGLDLDDLSPNADDDNMYATGGGIDPQEELQKLRNKKSASVQQRKSEYQAQKQADKRYKTAKEIVDAKRDFDNLNKQIEELNKEYASINERESNPNKRLIGESDMRIDEQKEAVLNKLSDVMGRRDQIQINLGGKPGTSAPKSAANQQGINYMQGKNINPSVNQLEDSPKTSDNQPSNKPSSSRQNKPSQTSVSSEASKVLAGDIFSRDWAQTNPGPSETPALQDARVESVNPYKYGTTQNGIDPNQAAYDRDLADALSRNPNSNKSKFDYSNILGNAINYGIPALQTAIGLRNLKKAGDRPKDQLDYDYLQALNKEKQNVLKVEKMAEYGFSPEERSLLDMQNQNLTNAGRYNARNLTGGGAANALGAERAVLNDAFGRNLMTTINDRNLQLQKQQDAMNRQRTVDQMVADKQDRLRQYFNDDLTAWNQKTQSAASLTNTGLSNALDSYRASERLKNFNQQMQQANQVNNPYNYNQ